ncbi:MAG: hypothetical protein KY395_07845, partial [Actinobacteria bacterium]|nr:hypothetical protein [Actinomycetota bacterium]
MAEVSELGTAGLAFAPTGKRKRRERNVSVILSVAAGLTILVSVAIVGTLLQQAMSFLRAVDLGSLSAIGWFPRRGMFDIRTLVAGTLLVTGVALLVAGPLGLGAAIYLSEYARPRARRILKPVLEVLAGVPSVVIGFFAIPVLGFVVGGAAGVLLAQYERTSDWGDAWRRTRRVLMSFGIGALIEIA